MFVLNLSGSSDARRRIGAGVGLGWIPEESAWCGTEYAMRGERANEAIEILDVGGHSPPALRRAGYRLEGHGVGDVLVQPWLFYGAGMRAPLEEKIEGMKRFARGRAAEAARDPVTAEALSAPGSNARASCRGSRVLHPPRADS